MKTFKLNRLEDETGVSGTGFVAEGVVFEDGRVALRWLTEHRSTTHYDSIDDVRRIHSHNGKTRVVFDEDGYIKHRKRFVDHHRGFALALAQTLCRAANGVGPEDVTTHTFSLLVTTYAELHDVTVRVAKPAVEKLPVVTITVAGSATSDWVNHVGVPSSITYVGSKVVATTGDIFECDE